MWYYILPLYMLAPQLFLHWISNLVQWSLIWSSISLRGSMRPHSRMQPTTLKGHSFSLCSSMFFRMILPQDSEFGQEIGVYLHWAKCLSMSPIFEIVEHSSLGQLMDNSCTKRRIGMFGRSCPTIRRLHRGHVVVCLMQLSQKRLWQHGVSTASSKMSKQMGQSHLSSERLLAAK
jgi:hypothetical protein